ncbi:TIGR03085 family metal-binding protein [Pseudactinotalea suaedae]|uniref:TIGR03085 family metal-binding protein n=1 Tax=Pseudactinotalea suaedae TaxID=1524924 RepID=UPI0012E3085D|nr:TIGR03085 family metal-binding protein [Pseudactinotalea suaedae]
MTRWDLVERQHLEATLRGADALAPTLCEGWEVRHLLVHLYLRRHQPWRTFNEDEGSVFAELSEQARDRSAYQALVERFASPVARLSPMALMDGPMGRLTNTVEYVVHHEDVRRGAGPVPARTLPAEHSDTLFDAVAQMARMTMRGLGVGVVLAVPGGRRRVVKRAEDSVAVVGSPVELALVASGRRRAADVELLGSDAAIGSFTAAF